MKNWSARFHSRLLLVLTTLACLAGCAASKLPQSVGQVSPFDRIKTAQMVLDVPETLPTKITRFSSKKEPQSITAADRAYAQLHSNAVLKSFVRDVRGRFIALAASQQIPLQEPTAGLPTLRLQPSRIGTGCDEQGCSTYLYVRIEALSPTGQLIWTVESHLSSGRKANQPDFDTFANGLFAAMKRDMLFAP